MIPKIKVLMSSNQQKKTNYPDLERLPSTNFWKNILNFEETVRMTALWYLSYLRNEDLKNLTLMQIKDYEDRVT